MTAYHVPVLFHEMIQLLEIKPSGVYVDCTYGGGGHSKGILQKLDKDGRLIAFDQDEAAKENALIDERFLFIQQNFRHVKRMLKLHKVAMVNGVIADLGVSSHQFDESERGFSIRFDGPLDMRMDQRQSLTAAQIIANYTELQLHKLFEQYGEVTNSKTLASHIVKMRSHMQIESIFQFKSMIGDVVKGNPNKYFAQVFQALRIEVNGEMEALRDMLLQLNDMVCTGGRVAIITFHSLEDRIVKTFFKNGDFNENESDNPFAMSERSEKWKIITKKPITASEEELKSNSRSRSAKLRVAERLPS